MSPSPEAMRDKCCPHLTSSMNLSLGASLTSSSLMAKIWSPGRSLSSEGPPARREGQGQPRHPGAVGWRGSRRVPSTPKAFAHVRGCGGHPAGPPEGTGEDRSPGRGPTGGKCHCVSRHAAAVSRSTPTPYLLPPTAPPLASRCQPQSRIRRGGGAGPSPVGACPKAAAHIPYHRHRAPPASHGCAGITGTGCNAPHHAALPLTPSPLGAGGQPHSICSAPSPLLGQAQLHPPVQSGAAQCLSLPQHQQLRQGDIHGDATRG